MPTRHKPGGNDTQCRKTGCCGSCCGGCTTKSSHTKANGRRRIREISSPLRPEQLSYVLSRNKQFDEHAIPSAWIAPFPSKNATDKSFKADTFHIDSLQQRISPSLIPTVPANVQSSAPASFLDDRQADKEDRSRQQWQHRLHDDDQSRTSLVCSLSAELASVGRHRFRLTYITDRLLVVSYPPNATKTDHNEGARWLCKAFEKRYGDNYRIFNLSGFTKELHFSSRTPVIDLFWGGSLAPALEQLVTAIDQLDFWLHNHDIGGSTTTGDGKRSKEASIVNNRVAVLHCTGPKSLLATYLAVYICQSKARFGPLCGQRPGSPTARGLQWNENRFRRFKNELVLGHTILKKFYEDNLARELNPSQKRYVGYFSGLLTGALILQDRLVYLHAIVYRDSSRGRYLGQPLEAIAENNENSLYAQPEDILARMQHATDANRGNYLPDNQNGDMIFDEEEEDWTGRWDQVFSPPEGTTTISAVRQHTGGGHHQQPTVGQISAFGPFQTFVDSECGVFLKIYQNLNLMHTTRVLCPNVNLRVERYIFPIEPVLPLHGDVLIACYIQPNFSAQFQELLFRAQFHTCAVDAEKLCFFKADLDEACEKALFPSTGCVELYFTSHRELLTEHTDNIERGCYIWTTAERESSILIDHHHHHDQRQRDPRQHRQQQQQQFDVLQISDKRFQLHDDEELDITTPLTPPAPAPAAPHPPHPPTTVTQFQEYYNGVQHRYKTDLSTTQLPHPSILSTSAALSSSSSRQALRILITTQEQLISVASGLFTGHISDTQPSMWPSSNHTQEIPDSSRPARSTLMRQISDPLSHPVIRGRSSQSQWINVQDASPHGTTNQIPLYQQALLSPRVQVPQKGSMQSEYPNTLTDQQQQQQQQQQQSQLTPNQSTGQVGVNRTNLAQLQSLYQQLLQQHQQLLQQQQQRQLQPNLDYPAGQLTDSNLYATVQRPPTTIPSSLVAGLQRVILQQQQQQQQQQQLHIPQTQPSMLPSVVYPQLTAIQPQPLTTLSLSGLSSTSAFSNLARALLPTSVAYNAAVGGGGGDSLTGLPGTAPLLTAPSLMPSSSLLPGLRTSLFAQPQQQQQATVQLLQNLPIQPTDHSYLTQQTRLGGPTNAGLVGDLTQPEMLNDPAWHAEQRRRIDLQRTRFLLNEQERKLFEELKNIRNRRAGLSRLEQLGRLGASTSSNVTPLESYRRATGRISTSEDARFRSRNRPLYAIGRSGSADAARVPLGSGGYYGYGDAYGSDLDEDSALLAILEQRLSRKPTESRRIYSDSEMGLQEAAGDIPLRIVGQQQRSGHVVDGSSQAFGGSLLPASLPPSLEYRILQPTEQIDYPPLVQTIVSPPYHHVKVHYEYDDGDGDRGDDDDEDADDDVAADGDARYRDISPLSDVVVSYGEQNEDMDLFPRRPRIQVVRSPVEASGRLPTFGASSSSTTRGRTFSGSPVIHPSQGQAYPKSKPPYTSPTKRSHFWGHSSYDEQWSRPPVADGPTIDRSSCTSPVQTHSGRLLRSPVSPPPRGYIRRPSELLDVGSQSDTGIIGGFGSRVYPGTAYSAHDYPNRRQYRGARGKTAVSAKRGQPSQMPLYRSPEVNKSHRQKHTVSTGLEHVPDNVFMVLSKISASAHIWYRPEMSRNDAMDLVRAEAPGTFVVRNSGSFPHSFGLVVKVDRHHTHGTEDESDSIRHYLIEGLQSTTASGLHHAVGVSGVILPPSNIPMDQSSLSVTHEPVRLRGSSNEPVFTNLVSLLYEHIIQPLALPCVLRLPFKSPAPINSLPSLITLTKSMDRISPVQVAPKYTSQVGAYHPARESPHGGALLRHPSDPLPADSGSYEMESYYPPPSHHHHHQQQQQPGMPPLPSSMHHSARQDGLLIAPPSGGSSSKVRPSRSPPAVYEGEMGPILPPDTGKTFTSIYLGSIDTENLTGSSAIRKAVDVLLENAAQVKQTEVTIRVSHEGLTVTDNWRKLFFRRNYPFHSVSFCAIDPCQRCWESPELRSMGFKSSLIFGFVARKQNTRENMCHVLCDTPEYNANIITDYIMHRLNEY